jgi:hypothetical protein
MRYRQFGGHIREVITSDVRVSPYFMKVCAEALYPSIL